MALIDRQTLGRAWSLFEAREKRGALLVLAMLCLSAIGSAAMVISVYPFLSLLADPSTADTMPLVPTIRDGLGLTTDYQLVVTFAVASMSLIVLTNLVLISTTVVLSRFAARRVHSLSRRLLAHYLAQPYTFFLDRHSGDLATNILSEAGQVVGGYVRPTAELIASLLTVMAVVAAVLAVNPLVGAIGLVVIGSFYGVVLAATRTLVRRLGAVRVEANTHRFKTASEVIGGIKDIKLLGQERSYLKSYSAASEELARVQSKLSIVVDAPRHVLQMFVFTGIILLCLLLLDPALLGTGQSLGGILPLLGLLAFAANRLQPEFHKIYHGFTQLRYGTAAVDRVWSDLSRGGSEADLPEVPPVPLGLGHALRLEGVSYVYPNVDRRSLREIDLEVTAGERIGIVGSTGAGKTTLADVMLGLLTPTEGRLLAGDVAVTPENVRAWQRSVSYVPQDIFLTDASVAENIALGVPADEVDRARVERCARMAQLHGFITEELPHGYETKTGERGVRLSGGQRQRIGIARALYHDADLIVLDEATSALDTLTEREVMRAIDSLPGETTVLIIAHRLSTVRRCDRIVYLEQGRIAGLGDWDSLCQSSAAFRELVRQSETNFVQVAE